MFYFNVNEMFQQVCCYISHFIVIVSCDNILIPFSTESQTSPPILSIYANSHSSAFSAGQATAI